MKNILFVNNSNDGASIAHIDDLEKLDENIPVQKDAKEAIKFTLKATGNGIGHSKSFGEFEVIHGRIIDMGMYLLINTLHDVFGHPSLKNTFLVENQVFCISNI